jgi:hypothetical protein
MTLRASYQPGVTPSGQQDTRPAFQKIEGDVGSLFAGLSPTRRIVLSEPLTENDHTVFVAGGNLVTLTLPSPALKGSSVGGVLTKRFEVVNTQAQVVMVVVVGGGIVNGASSYSITAGASVVFRTDGNQWYA